MRVEHAARPGHLTELLRAWSDGDRGALDRLIPLVHQELHRLARGCMAGERIGHSLQASALINEAYLRLIDVEHVTWQDRNHFLSMAARVMRRVLVEAARAKRRRKRGAEAQKITFDEALIVSAQPGQDLVALDDALAALAKVDERKSRVIELRFFGGLSVEETAQALNISQGTVLRDWRLAKAWLLLELGRDGAHHEQ